MKVGHLIIKQIHQGPLLGVEVEVEGCSLPPSLPGFKVVGEGSLRKVHGEAGREYVFKNPVALDTAMERLTFLHNKLNAVRADPAGCVVFSDRTSVHVHINVTDLTVSEWFTFLFLWVLYENAMIDYCGKERRGNLFCLSSRDAEGLMFRLAKFAQDRHAVWNVLDDEVRYCAVNIAATAKYGSVEFRTMRGTDDPAVLNPWLSTFVTLRNKAQELGSPKVLMDQLIADARGFTAELFPVGHFIYNYRDWYDDLIENIYRCSLIVDENNWDEVVFLEEPDIDI